MWIRFFRVYVSRHPADIEGVQPPTVEVKCAFRKSLRGIRSREAHDVMVLIFDPNAPHKTTVVCVLPRNYVDHHAADISENLPAHKIKSVVLAIEVIQVWEQRQSEPASGKAFSIFAGFLVWVLLAAKG